jgi:hypothetical protein
MLNPAELRKTLKDRGDGLWVVIRGGQNDDGLTTFYLYLKPSTGQVADIVYLKKV